MNRKESCLRVSHKKKTERKKKEEKLRSKKEKRIGGERKMYSW